MICKKHPLLFFLAIFFVFEGSVYAQKAMLYGVLKDNSGVVIEGLNVEHKNLGTITDKEGKYALTLPAKEKIRVVFSHLSYKTQIHELILTE